MSTDNELQPSIDVLGKAIDHVVADAMAHGLSEADARSATSKLLILAAHTLGVA